MAKTNVLYKWLKKNGIYGLSPSIVDKIKRILCERRVRLNMEKTGFNLIDKQLGGWCIPPTMTLLNFIVSNCLEGGEEYLEIGSYCGRRIVAALWNNNQKAHVIEPFDLFLPDGKDIESAWHKNTDAFEVADRITLHKANYIDFDDKLPPIGFLYYDGNHDAGYTYHALKQFEPYLADDAIIMVDDYYIDGGEQPHRWEGWRPVTKPVKNDTEMWVRENKSAELVGVAPWLHGQAIIVYQRGKSNG